MLVHFAATMVMLGGGFVDGAATTPVIHLQVDSARSEIIVTAGPIAVPAATRDAHHAQETVLPFRWPVSGWLRGYRIDLIDARGNALPRELIHHVGVANLDRRQLAYPKVERLFAVGRETTPVLLPSSMGVPLDSNQQLMLYVGLKSHADHATERVFVRVSIAWTRTDAKRPRDVFVLFLDVNPGCGTSSAFDLPNGPSTRASEFRIPTSGRLRVLGGHLHDHATEIRLEEVASGRVLARLRARRLPDGRITGVGRTRFLLTRGGLRLHANRTYRVVTVYDNRTGSALAQGGMGQLAGIFVPDDVRQWPEIDRADPGYQRDLASLLDPQAHAATHDEHDARCSSG